MVDELMPCPFCGAIAEIASNKKEVACLGCEALGPFCDTEAEAIAAWNTRAERGDSYTREDVESAFVSGYSLGTLPAGSDPRWDQNETTPEEEMAEFGWVRERTCRNIAEPDEMSDEPFTCSECGARGPYGDGIYHIGGSKKNEDGSVAFWDAWPVYKYCPNCGRKVEG